MAKSKFIDDLKLVFPNTLVPKKDLPVTRFSKPLTDEEKDELAPLFMIVCTLPTNEFDENGDPYYACFDLRGELDPSIVTGEISLFSIDDVYLYTIKVDDYVRFSCTYDAEEDITRLYFTQLPEEITPPEPVDPTPTPEEVLAHEREHMKWHIEEDRDNLIRAGIWVNTAYGNEHFSLNERDQILLLGINSMAAAGITSYPYHSLSPEANGTNMCMIYSDQDLAKIAMAAFAHITYHESYSNMLLQWLERESDLDVICNKIYYGATLPDDLMEYLGMILTASGIDPYMIPGYAEMFPYVPPYIQHAIPSNSAAYSTIDTDEDGQRVVTIWGQHIDTMYDHETFGELPEDLDVIDVTLNLPVKKGDIFTVAQVNRALENYPDDPSVSYNEESDVWTKVKEYTWSEDDTDENFDYKFLVTRDPGPIMITVTKNVERAIEDSEDGETETVEEVVAVYQVLNGINFDPAPEPEEPNPENPENPDQTPVEGDGENESPVELPDNGGDTNGTEETRPEPDVPTGDGSDEGFVNPEESGSEEDSSEDGERDSETSENEEQL